MSLILSAIESTSQSLVAFAAALAILIPATVGAIGMAFAISKTLDAIARQPEADSKLRTTLILGMVFIETTVIYALIVAIMIVIQLF
jgi:F-type H+-transporting ATPase subunit c